MTQRKGGREREGEKKVKERERLPIPIFSINTFHRGSNIIKYAPKLKYLIT